MFDAEELCLMALNIDAKFDGKLTCVSKNDLRNLANFHQSTFDSLKFGFLLGPFIQSRKYMNLKFTGELCVMTMKNDAKSEQELTGQFEIDMSNIMIFDSSTQNNNLHFKGLLLNKVYNV